MLAPRADLLVRSPQPRKYLSYERGHAHIDLAYIDLAQQLPAYLAKPEMPFFLWLRLLTGQRLMRLLSNAVSGPRARL
jgi:hypothetical protein